MEGLTVRQEAFCMEYAKTGNATEAYKQAGYKVRSDASAAAAAVQILKNIKVQERLKEIYSQIESHKIMGVAEMQERLTAIARQEATEEVPLGDGGIIERKADFKAALKAMELLGRMQGAFVDKKEVEIKGVVPVVLKDDV